MYFIILSIITGLVHNTFLYVKQHRRAHFQKLGAINEHFYITVITRMNKSDAMLFTLSNRFLDFTLDSVPYQATFAIHSYFKI